jgi:predicted TIM-barrel fold metal-dependent hydrolase
MSCDPDAYKARLGQLLELARFPGPRVKLSGFYGATSPATHDFPHRQAWGFIEALLDAFGAHRLLFGSDFSPALKHVTFQTLDVFRLMPFLSEHERRLIEGANLIALLDEAAASSSNRL